MRDQRDELADAAQVDRAADSHAQAPKPRRKPALPGAANRGPTPPQNDLDVPAAVPLHVRPVLTYAEVAAIGILPERSLRRLVATGGVKRSVMRVGRSVRFVRDILIAELLAAGE